MQEYSTTLPPTSSREFIHSILCRRTEGCTFYQRPCVDGTCPRCGGMSFLDKCIHATDEHELGRHEVNLQSFKYVTYDIDGGNERKKIQLVTSHISNKFLNAIVEMWTRKLSCFCHPCSSGEWDNCESIDWVDSWDHVSLPIGQQINSELS